MEQKQKSIDEIFLKLFISYAEKGFTPIEIFGIFVDQILSSDSVKNNPERYRKILEKRNIIKQLEEEEKILLSNKDKLTEEEYEIRYESLINKIEELLKEVIEILINKYDVIPSSVGTYLIKGSLIRFQKEKLESIKENLRSTKNISYEFTLNGQAIIRYNSQNNKLELCFKDYFQIAKTQGAKIRKTLNFLLIKANRQNFPDTIYFPLEEYMQATGMNSKDSAYRNLKKELDILKNIEHGEKLKQGKKEIGIAKHYIFTGYKITYNYCQVYCSSSNVKFLSRYFTVLPRWAGKLSSIAYDLIDYIFYLARQNTDKLMKKGYFTVSLRSIANYLGLPKPEETEHHKQLIINPILSAIQEINQTKEKEELQIEPIYNQHYKNVDEFLNGHLKIMVEPKVVDFFPKSLKKNGKKLPTF
mgnify:CR=1 FL=1